MNHSSSLSSLASTLLSPLFTPIITAHALLSADVDASIAQLTIHGLPKQIYHYDIKAFYPSIPHTLALTAFDYYFPAKPDERSLLSLLLSYNFLTADNLYYHLGPIGIPMGLPLAPEIARLVTAYQLDNLYTTFDPTSILHNFAPFIFTPEPMNTLQDAGYFPDLQEFCPNPFEVRTPIPIHPHRRMILKSHLSTIYRLARICSDPNIALYTSLSHFLGTLRLSGRDPADIISEIAMICYFPIRTEKTPPPDVDTINYAYSSTRPTINQLRPYRLIPILPMAPLKSLLTYNSPGTTSSFFMSNCAQ